MTAPWPNTKKRCGRYAWGGAAAPVQVVTGKTDRP
jgi:hypothetical protein